MTQKLENVNPKIIPVLNEFKTRLKELYGDNLKKVILYGSYARGEEIKSHSDIDVAVILAEMDSAYDEIDKINEATYEIDINNNVVFNFHPILAEDFESKPLSFYQIIKTEGIPI